MYIYIFIYKTSDTEKSENQCTAVASKPMAMQLAIARQNGRGVWLYNQLPATAFHIFSEEATERTAHSMARNVPISQGTEATIVTEYVPFRYFIRTASSLVWEPVQSRHAMMRNNSKPRLTWN